MVPIALIAHTRPMDEQTATMTTPRWYQRPVSRDPDDHKLGGIVAGLCNTFGFDVRTTRIGLVVATVVAPIMMLVYAALWLLLPSQPTEAMSFEAIIRDRRRLPLYIAIGIALVAGGVGSFGSWFLFGGVPWGLGLIAVGVLLWAAPALRSRHNPIEVAPAPLVPSGPSGPSGPLSWAPPTVGAAPGTPTPAPVSGPATPASGPAAARRVRRPIGAAAVVAAFAFAGIASLGEAFGWWDMSILAGSVTVLAILAAGAGLSAVVNRSWLPIPLMLIAGAALSVLALAQPQLEGGSGARTLTPTALTQLDSPTTMGTGELTIDLTALPVTPGRVELAMELGVGRLQLIVPGDATIELTSNLGAGELHIDGESVADGIRRNDARTIAPTRTGRAGTGTVFVINARVGIGVIDVQRGTTSGA
jgi:phage shock protein PspC (stress-responsive transcriptional regulator)